jgi:hypothetical protein
VVARWKDRAPWLFERPLGRGLGFVLTIPTSTDESDISFRPLFLALLERFVEAAQGRNGAHRTEVGQPWAFEGARSLEVDGPTKSRLPVAEEPTRKLVTPDRIGTYQIKVDGDTFARTVAPSEREVDLRPRSLAAAAVSPTLGDVHARVDLSPYLAVVLLGLLVGELALRLWARRNPTQPDAQPTS